MTCILLYHKLNVYLVHLYKINAENCSIVLTDYWKYAIYIVQNINLSLYETQQFAAAGSLPTSPHQHQARKCGMRNNMRCEPKCNRGDYP